MSIPSLPEKLDLRRFFTDSDHRHDLQIGTCFNQGGTRIVYLSSDIIRGIYNALEYEAGDAWRVILKNCGYIWGRRVAANLDREMQLLFKTQQVELGVAEYVKFIETYFREHGWGILTINLDKAASKGLIVAHLKNSIFNQVLADVDGFVDQMMEGILRALFEHISGQELDCLQVASEREQDTGSEFVVSAIARLDEVHALLEEQAGRDAIYAKLEA